MPSTSSFTVALSLGLLMRGRGGLAQMLLYALEKGPKRKTTTTKREINRWAQRSRNMVKAWCSFNIYAGRFWASVRSRCLDIDQALFCFCVRACVFFKWIETKSRSIKTQKGKRPVSSHLGVILGVKTCEVFLCFLAIISSYYFP